MSIVEAIRLARQIDLPRAIVWEALVDPVLVSGWLHPHEGLLEGSTPLEFREPDDPQADAQLAVASPTFGTVRVRLLRVEGGTRGESTRLEVRVSDVWGRRDDRAALWELRLDQLEDLLRGHPVDWARWPEEHGAEDAAARSEARFRPAR
ncbi:hypothetical protein [Protaetiibacter mangrovi]|uniref:SRPBCC family protein n=1 Tax=Protaetiibacter mangrovi TaxID=2970926 RepID=A0ABT1ZBA5_9MICO|nr:hypothetical protein [Protaetiibacter mangrovi]MCS0497993.1 hypothetical protein [Protaetiibacter mangrovi]TPW91521.1 hypothetical protein FJ656_35790 [Schumannella luteola]